MKKLFVLISMIGIIGIVIPSFAVSPEKINGDNSKPQHSKGEKIISNNNLSTAPPANYQVPIHVVDASVDCDAQSCTLKFIAEDTDSECVPLGSGIVGQVNYTSGTANYLMMVTTNASYIIIRIIDDPSGSCEKYNSNTCCVNLSDIRTCNLYVCP